LSRDGDAFTAPDRFFGSIEGGSEFCQRNLSLASFPKREGFPNSVLGIFEAARFNRLADQLFLIGSESNFHMRSLVS